MEQIKKSADNSQRTLAERMRLERTMPCGTPHFQCGSLPLEYLSMVTFRTSFRLTVNYYIEHFSKNQAFFQKILIVIEFNRKALEKC